MSGTEPFSVFITRKSRQRAGRLPGERESEHPEDRGCCPLGSDPQLPKGQFVRPLSYPGATPTSRAPRGLWGASAWAKPTWGPVRTSTARKPQVSPFPPNPLASPSPCRRVSLFTVSFPRLCKLLCRIGAMLLQVIYAQRRVKEKRILK